MVSISSHKKVPTYTKVKFEDINTRNIHLLRYRLGNLWFIQNFFAALKTLFDLVWPMQWNGTQNGMTLKTECHSKWNVTQYRITFKMKCHSKKNITQNGISLKMECHLKLIGTQNEMSLKVECPSKRNVTKDGMSPKMECHSK